MSLPRCLVALAASAFACASSSPRWQQGGAPTRLDAAYWSRQKSTIELRPSGEIIEDDTLLFRLDRSGRVSDAQGEPVAVLQSDGWLVAEDDTPLGFIGPGASFRADQSTPTVRVLPSGDAVIIDRAGRWLPAGRWDYCQGSMLRTCTLVTHVVAARDAAREPKGSGSANQTLDVLKLLEILKLAR
jgi:hypothetical protein